MKKLMFCVIAAMIMGAGAWGTTRTAESDYWTLTPYGAYVGDCSAEANPPELAVRHNNSWPGSDPFYVYSRTSRRVTVPAGGRLRVHVAAAYSGPVPMTTYAAVGIGAAVSEFYPFQSPLEVARFSASLVVEGGLIYDGAFDVAPGVYVVQVATGDSTPWLEHGRAAYAIQLQIEAWAE